MSGEPVAPKVVYVKPSGSASTVGPPFAGGSGVSVPSPLPCATGGRAVRAFNSGLENTAPAAVQPESFRNDRRSIEVRDTATPPRGHQGTETFMPCVRDRRVTAGPMAGECQPNPREAFSWERIPV